VARRRAALHHGAKVAGSEASKRSPQRLADSSRASVPRGTSPRALRRRVLAHLVRHRHDIVRGIAIGYEPQVCARQKLADLATRSTNPERSHCHNRAPLPGIWADRHHPRQNETLRGSRHAATHAPPRSRVHLEAALGHRTTHDVEGGLARDSLLVQNPQRSCPPATPAPDSG